MTRAKHRKRRPLLTLLLILALFPLAGVAVHRFLPPLATILMVKQAAAGHGRIAVEPEGEQARVGAPVPEPDRLGPHDGRGHLRRGRSSGPCGPS